MSGSILWKAGLTVLVLAWALWNIIPLDDTPFPEYLREQATANEAGFEELLLDAEAMVANGDKPSVFVALRDTIREENIDLSRYFPQLDVSDIRNVERRNETLLRYLLDSSRAALKLGLDLRGGVAVTYQIDDEGLSDNQFEREEQVQQARSVVARRVDGLGVAEPQIRVQGDNRIEVQMPGISTQEDPEAFQAIGKPALLEFSTVHRTQRPNDGQPAPIGYIAKVMQRENPRTGEIQEVPYYVKRIPDMTGEAISRAGIAMNEAGGYKVTMSFTDEGGDQFARLTREIAEDNNPPNDIGQLAILLDGELISAPTVRFEILGGSAEITGDFSQREALELANALNNPLEVGMQIDEMYEVGPSLAAGSRDASMNAGMLGAGLVIAFMVLYYLFGGVIAMLSVGMNIVFVLGALASIGATITLPGVAALVLTIGMAVDANILIFERIREELRAGKSLPAALTAGYEKAFSTILDANVTTLITALILYFFGTGPVKGFGVTLAIGILGTLFFSLVATRFILESLIHTGIIRKLLPWTLFKAGLIPFLNYARPAFITSWAIVLLGVATFAVYFEDSFGIDFVGGDEVTLAYENVVPIAEVEATAAEAGIEDVAVTYQTMLATGDELMKVQTESGRGVELAEILITTFPNAGLELAGQTTIGAAVGEEVAKDAVTSVLLALFFILLYVAIRFEFGYGLGALVATVHDIFMTVGLFVLLGDLAGLGSGQFSAPMIAAILMVVGYSINDTIVVFDRVREELTLNPGMNLRKVVHLSINRVLSRTILTSITTLLATLSLYIFGAGVIVDFALVFLIGILTGTFSSIFIASPVFYWYHRGDRRHVEAGTFLPSYEWQSTNTNKPAEAPTQT